MPVMWPPGGKVIDVVEAPEAAVIIIPRNPEKTPKTWYLHTLRVHSVSANTTMPFEALLTNGVPPGQSPQEQSSARGTATTQGTRR